jgi:hypothetical protein
MTTIFLESLRPFRNYNNVLESFRRFGMTKLLTDGQECPFHTNLGDLDVLGGAEEGPGFAVGVVEAGLAVVAGAEEEAGASEERG